MERICEYNTAIMCDSEECYHCGWHPDVAGARKKKLLDAANNQKLYKVPFTGYCEVWATSPEKAAEKAEDIDQQFFAQYDYGDPVCLEKEEENELD